MSRELAHQLLDRAKAGELVSEAAIREALRATGDLEHSWAMFEAIDATRVDQLVP